MDADSCCLFIMTNFPFTSGPPFEAAGDGNSGLHPESAWSLVVVHEYPGS